MPLPSAEGNVPLATGAVSPYSGRQWLHLPAVALPSYFESSEFWAHRRDTVAQCVPISHHGGQVPAKLGQFDRIRWQRAVHGSCEPVHLEEQGADGLLFGSAFGSMKKEICLTFT